MFIKLKDYFHSALGIKFILRMNLESKAGRRKKEINEEEKEWIEEFLERADVSYTIPDRKDTVYIAIVNSKRNYKKKRYLLWKIWDLLDIINGSKIITSDKFLHLPKLLIMKSHFAKYINSSKVTRRWLTTTKYLTPLVCAINA